MQPQLRHTPPQGFSLYDGGLHPKLPGPYGRDIPPRSRTDHRQVVIGIHLILLHTVPVPGSPNGPISIRRGLYYSEAALYGSC